MRLRAGGERSDFLVADVHPADLILTANGVGEGIQAIADDAVNSLDARCRQSLCELICNGCHGEFPCLVNLQGSTMKLEEPDARGLTSNFRAVMPWNRTHRLSASAKKSWSCAPELIVPMPFGSLAIFAGGLARFAFERNIHVLGMLEPGQFGNFSQF